MSWVIVLALIVGVGVIALLPVLRARRRNVVQGEQQTRRGPIPPTGNS